MQKGAFGAKMLFCRQKTQKGQNAEFMQNCIIGENGKKVNARLSVTEGEQDFPGSGPERIHGRGRHYM